MSWEVSANHIDHDDGPPATVVNVDTGWIILYEL